MTDCVGRGKREVPALRPSRCGERLMIKCQSTKESVFNFGGKGVVKTMIPTHRYSIYCMPGTFHILTQFSNCEVAATIIPTFEGKAGVQRD